MADSAIAQIRDTARRVLGAPGAQLRLLTAAPDADHPMPPVHRTTRPPVMSRRRRRMG